MTPQTIAHQAPLLKPGLENFEHYFASMWDEFNCAVVWAFFGIAFLWDWNENWPFPILWPLLSFPDLLAHWVFFSSLQCFCFFSILFLFYILVLTYFGFCFARERISSKPGDLHCLFTVFFKLFISYWSIADQQCCDRFRLKAKGFRNTYTCIHSPSNPLSCKLPLNTEQSSLCYTVGPCWLPILNIAVCQFGIDMFPTELFFFFLIN